MKRIVVVLVVVVLGLMLASCATYQAYSTGATADVKKAALCEDAAMGLQLAAIGLQFAGTPAQADYWTAYQGGASAQKLICGGK